MMTQRWIIGAMLAAVLVLAPVTLNAQDSPAHPRLFFDANELQTLREQAATTHEPIWLAIQTYANSQLGTTPPSAPSAEATELDYRTHGDVLIPLAFSCAITEQPEYCDLSRDYLLAYVSWPQWDVTNRRDLGLAHMLIGTSLAYDWTYNTLSEADRQTIAEGIAAKANQMYEASVGPYNDEWTNWWAGSYVQNHFSTNNSALGIAGLALAGDVSADTQAWVTQAAQEEARVSYLLNQIQDGSWHESIPYQSYMLTIMLAFLSNLRDLQGIDLIPHQYLQNYTDWRIYNYLPGRHEHILSFGDFELWWGNSFDSQNILRFIANEYDSSRAEWMAQQTISTTGRGTGIASVPWQVFEFLYYDPNIPAEDPTGLSGAAAFPDLGAVIWRTGWSPEDLVFGLKAGGYGGNFPLQTFANQLYPWGQQCEAVGCTFNVGHDHADANTFYLYNQGQWLAPEWASYGVRDTGSHNTIVIDGENQFLPDNTSFADPTSFIDTAPHLKAHVSSPGFNYLASDATNSYTAIEDLNEFTRHVVYVKPGYFLMLDTLDADSPHTYFWFSHFAGEATIDGNWVRGSSGENQLLGVGIVSPQPFDAILSADALPYIRISPPTNMEDVRFINLLYPTNTDGWDARPQPTLVEDTGRAALTQVQLPDGRVDEIIIGYGGEGTIYRIGNYGSNARVAIIRRDADSTIEAVYMYGGSFLTDTALGAALVNNVDAESAFEVTFSEGTAAVTGQLSNPVTLFAPNVTTITVNGETATVEQRGDFLTFGG